jgi:hypothetical protein
MWLNSTVFAAVSAIPNRAQQRAAAGALIGGHEQFLDTIASDRRDDPELGKMGADRIDHSCLPADEQMARAIEREVRNALAFLRHRCRA